MPEARCRALGPLGDPYAELYWELLSTLYTCEFEREPFIVLRPVAIEIAENAIQLESLWTERRADLEELAREEVSLEFNHVSLCLMEAGGQSGRLSEVAAEADHFEARIHLHKVREQHEAAVHGSVVYEDHLVGRGQGLQH